VKGELSFGINGMTTKIDEFTRAGPSFLQNPKTALSAYQWPIEKI